MSSGYEGYADGQAADLAVQDPLAIRLELAKLQTADAALQQMIDALGSMPNIDQFVPIALRIVAEALNTNNCSYYEHRVDDLIRLRYWFFDNHVFSPEEIVSFTDESLSLLGYQTQGFTVSDSHLGSPVRQRTRACVVDHTRLDPPSINTELCKARGWEQELNVPLVVGGVAEGAIVALRGAGDSWSAHEILLAERLAQPFALAIETSRIAALAKDAAITREREAAALRRADEVTRASDVMLATLERLSDERDLLTFPSTILREAMRQTGSNDGVIFLFDPDTTMVRATDFVLEPESNDKVIAALSRPHPPIPQKVASRLRAPVIFDLTHEGHMLPPGAAEWHQNRGNLCVIVAPMFVNKALYGFFSFAYRTPAASVSQVNLSLINGLAQQASLAIQLAELAGMSQRNAIAAERQQVIVQERAHMAREIHDRLAQGYAAILMQQRAMRRSICDDLDAAISHLDSIERISRESLAEARRTMDELKSNAFEPGSLSQAVTRAMAQMAEQTDFSINLLCDTELPLVPRYVETELSCIIAEALSNARRHSRCTAASIIVGRNDGKLTICVRDEGLGFDLGAQGPSFGIPSMYERAARAGADLEIASVLGHGTEVRITLEKRQIR